MNSNNQQQCLVEIDVASVQSAFGQELLSKVILLLSAQNKLEALWDLMHLTHQYDRKKVTARLDRNIHASAIISFGILHEFKEVLTSMCHYIRKNGPVHNKIKSMLRMYKNDEFSGWLTDYRNFVSMHLAKKLLDKDAIPDITAITPKVCYFIKADSIMHRDTHYAFADSIIDIAFFRKKHDELLGPGKVHTTTFEEFYEGKRDKFYDYAKNVHKSIIGQPDKLIICLMQEYGLTAGEASSS